MNGDLSSDYKARSVKAILKLLLEELPPNRAEILFARICVQLPVDASAKDVLEIRNATNRELHNAAEAYRGQFPHLRID